MSVPLLDLLEIPRADLRRLPSSWRVCVVSPHLDDAVFSVGATIYELVQAGLDVTVATVLAGDPSALTTLDAPAARAGFTSSAEEAQIRRAEDVRACALLGAKVHWGDLSGLSDSPASAEAVIGVLQPLFARTDLVLTPGFPLRHQHHALVAAAVDQLGSAGPVYARYVEQPYASWEVLNRHRLVEITRGSPTARRGFPEDQDVRCLRTSISVRSYRQKVLAMNCYASQLRILRRFPRTRILGHEALVGGERIAWPRTIAAEIVSTRGAS